MSAEVTQYQMSNSVVLEIGDTFNKFWAANTSCRVGLDQATFGDSQLGQVLSVDKFVGVSDEFDDGEHVEFK